MNQALYKKEINRLEVENQQLKQKLNYAGYLTESRDVQKHIEKLTEQIETLKTDLAKTKKLNETFKQQIQVCDFQIREQNRLLRRNQELPIGNDEMAEGLA